MDEASLPDIHTAAVIRAHLRRVVIGEILATLTPDEAERAISVAVQRLAQYVDEGPVQSVARMASQDQLQRMIDQVIEELQSILPTLQRARQ